MDLPTDWSRPLRQFTAPAGKALVCYEVHGELRELPKEPPLDAYRLDRDLSGDIQVLRISDALADHRQGLAWSLFERDHGELAARVTAAPDAMVVRGNLYEPATLVYLRHAIGLVQLLLDHGGLAVHDLQTLRWYSAAEWKAELFKDQLLPHEHVMLLTSQEDDGERSWIRSRGMRKFGRPDVSVRRVPREHRDQAAALVNRLVAIQVRGATVPEGQPITSSPDGPVCRHQPESEEFANEYVEIAF